MDHPRAMRGGAEHPAEVTGELPILSFTWPQGPEAAEVLPREWLVTNGMGSYASGSIAMASTRKYHGLFIPCLPGGRGRTVMLARMGEEAFVGEARYRLDVEERADGEAELSALRHLRAFRLRGLIPEWDYRLGEHLVLMRRLVFVHGENTVFLGYQLKGPGEVRLRLRPFPVHRGHEHLPQESGHRPIVRIEDGRVELRCHDDAVPVRMRLFSACEAPFVALGERSPRQLLRVERARGYEHEEVQESPGYFECKVAESAPLYLGMTCDSWEALRQLRPEECFEFEHDRERKLLERAGPAAATPTGARLTLAADQFVIEPSVRPADEAWARATGQDARSVIAGYHWFTDWGRDTMISLEGLTLTTGRRREAAAILRTFQHYVRDGLLPNLFPEGAREGLYHTADATMWFFHAVDRYLEVTADQELLRDLFPTLAGIVDHHVRGTHYNIGVDPSDGLLRQGQEGYQLTWMDAKVEGWVVTPRRGKAVEINALWFNALRLMAEWAPKVDRDPAPYLALAERAQRSFNEKFWNEAEGCLYDVVDTEGGGNDPAVRPNQVLAIAPRFPVLAPERWERVLRKVHGELLTPVGLRSLSPRHPDYKARYDGDLRTRDAAYHQGTVWAWLIGPFIDAELKVNPDKAHARRWLEGLERHLGDAGIGSVSEIFDAAEPFRARGCIAQAWSVAELLRTWVKTAPS